MTAGMPLVPPFPVTDLHSHLVPDVDDGTHTIAESLESLRGLYAEGVRALITTPHLIIPRYPDAAGINAELARHRRAFDELVTALERASNLPRLALGQELWLPDAYSARRALEIEDLGLGGSSYLLIEFGFQLAGTHEDVVATLQEGGRRVLIAHAERYHYPPGIDPIDQMRAWRGLGALLQVNSGSLTGHYRSSSPRSEALAWEMVEAGLVDVISSDHHGPRRAGVSPGEAYRALAARGRLDVAERAMGTVPGTIADAVRLRL